MLLVENPEFLRIHRDRRCCGAHVPLCGHLLWDILCVYSKQHSKLSEFPRFICIALVHGQWRK